MPIYLLGWAAAKRRRHMKTIKRVMAAIDLSEDKKRA